MSIVAKNLAKILARVKDAANLHKAKIPVRLCAVSKTKPLVDLQAAYDVGQRHFGENYVQELVSKAPDMPADVLWHFIGKLQSNKCKHVATIKNLFLVETIDKTSLAKALDKACKKVGRPTKLNVLVQVRDACLLSNSHIFIFFFQLSASYMLLLQVNTSGEESKSGAADLETALEIVQYINDECSALQFKGYFLIQGHV